MLLHLFVPLGVAFKLRLPIILSRLWRTATVAMEVPEATMHKYNLEL